MKAVLRRTRISPKKANLIAGLVRGKNVQDALDFLNFLPKKGAKTLAKTIKSAASNAEHNYNQDKGNLIISQIIVTKGPTYKRHIPISRGRVAPLLKRTSHITVEVTASQIKEAKKSRKKEETAK